MRFLPLVIALLLAACSTPEDKATAHQRQLNEEARANFLALKAIERKNAPPKPVARAETPPASRAGLLYRFTKPVETWKFWTSQTKPRNDGTVYYHDLPQPAKPKAVHHRAALRKYARKLGKKTADLTAKERAWARAHY
jgi:nitrous oxide reductase accessory protein NosL